jgi:purine-binding chemotaxis protein CheW
MTESENGKKQLCTFLVDGLTLGIDVTQVQEVLRYQDTTPVPLAPGVVGGLINLRGQIVTALDLRHRMGAPPRIEGELPMNVVVRHSDGVVSFLVDEIGDVVDVDDASFEPPPETLGSKSKALVQGVYKLESQLLLLLNTELAMRVGSNDEERSQDGQR